MKKLFTLMSIIILGVVVAGCGADNTDTNEVIDNNQAQVEADIDDTMVDEEDMDDDALDEEAQAPITMTDDLCETYINTLQCFVDAYPEEYENGEADIAELKAAIYDNEDDDHFDTQRACGMSIALMQNAVQQSEEEFDDVCGLLDIDVEEVDFGFNIES